MYSVCIYIYIYMYICIYIYIYIYIYIFRQPESDRCLKVGVGVSRAGQYSWRVQSVNEAEDGARLPLLVERRRSAARGFMCGLCK